MATWTLTKYSLNSKIYAPLDPAILQNVALKNVTKDRLQVTKVLLKFDCQEGNQYSKKCNISIKSDETIQLPSIKFTIPLVMSTGAQRYRVGVETKQFLNSEWKTKESFAVRGKFIEIQPLKPKDYKIFISHSNSKKDLKLIKACREAMVTCGLTGYFAESDNQAGELLWDKILREISSSDILLVLWTEDGSKSGDIREEIGIALGGNIKIIPVVQNGITVFGSLKARGIEWISYKPRNEINALSDALEKIMDFAKAKIENKAVLERVPKVKRTSTKISKTP